MTMRVRGALAVAVLVATAACKSVTAGGSYEAEVRDQMRDYRFPKPCEELWVDALRVLADAGFGLVGNDRKLVGQQEQGFVTNFLNRGHATTRDDDGMYESETDANGQMIRYVVRGKPAPKGGCYVTYVEVTDDRSNSTERRHRDYEKELKLLSVVDPAAAAGVAEKADKASR